MAHVTELTDTECETLSRWVEQELKVYADADARLGATVILPVSDAAIAAVARRCYELVREFAAVIGAPAEAIIAEVEGVQPPGEPLPVVIATSDLPAGVLVKEYAARAGGLVYGPVPREDIAKLYGHIACKRQQLASFELLRLWRCPRTSALYETSDTIIHPPEAA
jgi:hypothetical protein